MYREGTTKVIKEIVTLAEGTYQEAELKDGSFQIIVTLPPDKPMQARTMPHTPEKEPLATKVPSIKKNVLYVEDTDRTRDLISYYLKGDFEVTTAEDAESALQLVAKRQFDFVLMDVDLGPGMNGLDCTRLLRKMPNYTDIPIVAITGYTERQDASNALSAGCNAYLTKPFLKEDLIKVLSEFKEHSNNILK